MSFFEVIYEQNLRHGGAEKTHFLVSACFPSSISNLRLTYEFDDHTKQIPIHCIRTIMDHAVKNFQLRGTRNHEDL